MEKELTNKGVNVDLVKLSDYEINPYHRPRTADMDTLAQKITESDNIIIGMGIYNYSISDALKIILDNCFGGSTGKFYGLLTAAGGDKSFLATMNLTQICMNQYRMIQLPRIIYATGSDFVGDDISNEDLLERLASFANEFYDIGTKLL